MDLSDTVQIVGIWGMGGIGKTTLATAIFNQFSSEFEGRCFMSDVRRNSETGGGLEHLQKQMLSTILSEKLEVAGPNIPQFTKERVRRMKVLIVLDDVNKVGQLEGLIGGLDQYGPGSRIVVTTRDKGVLEKFGVEEEKIYGVNGLEFDEAFELFCNFAFEENHCPEDLNWLSRRVVWYATSNPLVLKVLGSSLCLKRKSHWENVLDDLNRICESEIHDIYDILKISFNELIPREKSMFLDIACFFEGEDKDIVMRILDDSESYALGVLIDKSLITISHNCLQMHDLLQEMGRQIGTDAIEGIFMDLSKIEGINLDSRAFTNMSNLRMLKFYVPKFLGMIIEEKLEDSKVQLPDGIDYLPKYLRYLHWYKYPLRTLPSNFKPKNIVELSLRFSKVEQIWEGKKKAFKLKSIDLSHSEHLIRIPDLSEIPNLERIYLSNCTNLVHVPASIQNFKYLSMLDFKGCKSLRSFPSNLHFVCPVTINFSSCVNLIEFPQISGKITRLYLSQSAIEEVPSSIECLTDLVELDLRDCKRLKRISTRFCKLKSLVKLCLDDCLNLERFPEILEEMEHLKRIYLERTAITELPSSFENLLGLEFLTVSGCSKLDKLPDNIGNLKSLDFIAAVGSAIKSLKARNCKGLQSLPEIPSCLQELDASVLEKLSKHSPDRSIKWRYKTSTIYFEFTNCLELNGKANNKILADSRLRIRHMAIASLRLGHEKTNEEKLSEVDGPIIVLPGSEIPDWFSNQSSGSSICIQLPPHSFCRNLIGFALCAVLDFKQLHCDCLSDFYVSCQLDLEIKTLSKTKHVDLGFYLPYFKYSIDSDHVILGFKPCSNVGFPDGYHHTTASFKFFAECNQKRHRIKRYGVCPVYVNPSETKANTFTLNFATEVWKLDDLASASGTSDEEELEPSPKRIFRADQINMP
ncbi:hypothetical protein CUMW_084740 [Citrus unshiu]|nr:hypothetical protein CUMW_084740 [Citrus unshiu]